ncbi:MAG: response regulator transcription factor [Gallionella sp.]|nr:MAG: response regulator transcription factor [Gallionella sp.]
MEKSNATVYIVDDDPDVREALRYLIESVQLEARAFPSIAEFLDSYRPGNPGCMVLDVRMPGMSGMEFLERREPLGVGLPVIMLSGNGTVPMATRALRSGAVDFVQKPVNEQLLLDRVHEAIDLSRKQMEQESLACRLSGLTPREMEVVRKIADGLHNKEIARQLKLSNRTVESHRAHAMRKLDMHTTADLVALVVRQGAAPGGAQNS